MLKEIKHIQATADLLYSEKEVEAALDKWLNKLTFCWLIETRYYSVL